MAIRVSSDKQGLDGDSPEAQPRTRRSLRQGAQYHNYRDDYFARIGVARNAADAKK